MRWRILDGGQTIGADHEVIEWEFNVKKPIEVDHGNVKGWNLPTILKRDRQAAQRRWKQLQ